MPILSIHSVMTASPRDRFGIPRKDRNDGLDHVRVRFGLSWLGDG